MKFKFNFLKTSRIKYTGARFLNFHLRILCNRNEIYYISYLVRVL